MQARLMYGLARAGENMSSAANQNALNTNTSAEKRVAKNYVSQRHVTNQPDNDL
jgi:hypothetical protein